MTWKYVIPVMFGACSALSIPAHIAPDINACKPPPEGVIMEGSQPASLIDCVQGSSHQCCAYGFLPNHQYVCYHVLCQPVDCTTEWEYIKTVCPPPEVEEKEVSWPKSEQPNPEYQLNHRKFRS